MIKKAKLNIRWLFIICYVCISTPTFSEDNNPIARTMQRVINQIYKTNKIDLYNNGIQEFIINNMDSKSLHTLANDYWTFSVNTDVEVLVCRDITQKEVPYWLHLNDFKKTSDFIKNENVTYEVWSKIFKKGKVSLGINGFDRHRYVYFIAIKPLNKNQDLSITPIWPIDQKIFPLTIGSYIYKDWDELTITEYSSYFDGAFILPTYRGRSREAHLIGAFRSTDFPSSSVPDQIIFSWTEDPSVTQTISWRTDRFTKNNLVKYWKANQGDTIVKKPSTELLHDMLLQNDPIINRSNVTLTDLEPNTSYQFQIITDIGKSRVYSFKTAPKDDSFEFGWFGDMHNDPNLRICIELWRKKYPDANFYLQAGDLVNTGLYRDHWDQLLEAIQPIADHKPFMAVPGNHDSQEALFPSMYLSYLKYPHNGPDQLPKGLSYHFNYGNSLFVMIDAVTLGVDDQKEWIEKVLKNSSAKFKFVVFHFAPHTFESTYPDIIASWEPIFNMYGVDLVFNGHFHYYHKTAEHHKPKYVMSVATKSKGSQIKIKEGETYKQIGYLYQHVKVNKNNLELWSIDSEGNIIDQFKLIKN